MMGKAHYYKHDYISARRVFDYVAKQYEDDPIHYNGYLWLAKTYIETENYAKAEAALNFLQSRYDEKGFPYDVKRDLQMVSADLYIAMGNYDMAYGFLERGIEMGNKRDIVTRAYFILGQINQMEGNLTLASSFYKKVIKMRLNIYEQKMIKKVFLETFKNGHIYLFGSRVDDSQKGGDIDLYIDSKNIENPFEKKIEFLVSLKQKIGDQKIDVIISKDKTRVIEKEALQYGIKL
jgi:tetratricopeptide (TPR) repeat protein